MKSFIHLVSFFDWSDALLSLCMPPTQVMFIANDWQSALLPVRIVALLFQECMHTKFAYIVYISSCIKVKYRQIFACHSVCLSGPRLGIAELLRFI